VVNETEAFWAQFLTDLRDRGLVAEVGRILQGSAWQR
jgi:hypothetical protein